MHTILPFLLAMIATIILLEMLATKLKVAYPILLVIAGLLISFIPGLPVFSIDPDLIFFIFLPPLLFEAAWSISFKEMKKWWRIIGSFAFLVVFFTAMSVALVTNHFIPGFTIALGFLLGGIVSPPDAVSMGAILKFVKIPKSTTAILQGESLMNDASSLIIFRFALVAVGTGQFGWQDASLSFLWMLLGGAGIGLILGWLLVKAHKMLPTDATSDVALSIIAPYILYWVSEQVESSGVLSVVVGGLFMATRRHQFLTSASRVRGHNVWESFVFILNGLVFLIIGLELPEIVAGLKSKGIPISTAVGYSILVTVVLIGARMLSAYMAMLATYLFRPNVIPSNSSRTSRIFMPVLLGWTGMRGVVSLAAALAIPIGINGVEFPFRNLILFITFVVILLTLMVQGLTLPYLIKKANLEEFEEDNNEEAKRELKQGLRDHVIQFVKNKYENNADVDIRTQKMIRHWTTKSTENNEEWMNETTKANFLEILELQRDYLLELNKKSEIDEELIRTQLYQIDLEEERLKII